MTLDNRARQVMNTYLKALVKNTIDRNGSASFAALPDAAAGWPVDDKHYNKFLKLVVDNAKFLAEISFESGFDTTTGRILRHNLTQRILKRTNVTDTVRRLPNVVGTSTAEDYNLRRAEFDTYLPYDSIRHWAHKGPQFLAQMIRGMVATSFGNDLLWVAMNGISDTDPPVAADLSDFAKGWIQLVKDNAAANVMSEVVTGSGKIFIGDTKVVNPDAAAMVDVGGGVVGIPATAHGFKTGANLNLQGFTDAGYLGEFLVLASSTADQINITATYAAETPDGSETMTQTGDYKSLDALVADLKNGVDPQLFNDNFKAVTAHSLYTAEEELVYGNVGQTPTEKLALSRLMDKLGGLPRRSPAAVPAGTIIVTDPRTLAIYSHKDFHRRFEDKPELNGYVLWQDTYLDWIVTDWRLFMAAENVEFM